MGDQVLTLSLDAMESGQVQVVQQFASSGILRDSHGRTLKAELVDPAFFSQSSKALSLSNDASVEQGTASSPLPRVERVQSMLDLSTHMEGVVNTEASLMPTLQQQATRSNAIPVAFRMGSSQDKSGSFELVGADMRTDSAASSIGSDFNDLEFAWHSAFSKTQERGRKVITEAEAAVEFTGPGSVSAECEGSEIETDVDGDSYSQDFEVLTGETVLSRDGTGALQGDSASNTNTVGTAIVMSNVIGLMGTSASSTDTIVTYTEDDAFAFGETEDTTALDFHFASTIPPITTIITTATTATFTTTTTTTVAATSIANAAASPTTKIMAGVLSSPPISEMTTTRTTTTPATTTRSTTTTTAASATITATTTTTTSSLNLIVTTPADSTVSNANPIEGLSVDIAYHAPQLSSRVSEPPARREGADSPSPQRSSSPHSPSIAVSRHRRSLSSAPATRALVPPTSPGGPLPLQKLKLRSNSCWSDRDRKVLQPARIQLRLPMSPLHPAEWRGSNPGSPKPPSAPVRDARQKSPSPYKSPQSHPLQSLNELSPLMLPMRSPAKRSVSPLPRTSLPLSLDVPNNSRKGSPSPRHTPTTPSPRRPLAIPKSPTVSSLRRISPLRPLEASKTPIGLPHLSRTRSATPPSTSVTRAIWTFSPQSEESGDSHLLPPASPSCTDATISPSSVNFMRPISTKIGN